MKGLNYEAEYHWFKSDIQLIIQNGKVSVDSLKTCGDTGIKVVL